MGTLLSDGKRSIMATIGNVNFTGADQLLPPSIHLLSDSLINDDVRRVLQLILYGVLCQAVNVFGTVANIINIICFVRIGLKDSVNISLLGLSISDLGCLSTLIFTNICLILEFDEYNLPFEAFEMQYLISGWPHVIFTRITSLITALITLERCLCIAMPLTVNKIITPQRVTIAIVVLFFAVFCSGSPVYYSTSLGWRFSVQRNKTLLGLVFTQDREKFEKVAFTINNIFIPFGTFVMIIVCTSVLVINLQNKTKWRQNSVAMEQAQAITTRDQKVTKMVVVISALFIACFFPVCIIFLSVLLVPGLSVDGKYKHELFLFSGFVAILGSTNSAFNIFFYYNMSSKYKVEISRLFRLHCQQIVNAKF